ncbi:hypothetical protein HMPREF3212_01680 [Citrobacter freundii]|nr:hypothetical protein HMPREF3212_01680 [Citrobacter freundii]
MFGALQLTSAAVLARQSAAEGPAGVSENWTVLAAVKSVPGVPKSIELATPPPTTGLTVQVAEVIVPVKLIVPLFADATEENATAEASAPRINSFFILTPGINFL